MSPETISLLKVFAAGGVWVACLIQVLDKHFGPDYLVTEKDPLLPEWAIYAGAWIGLAGATGVVLLEIASRG